MQQNNLPISETVLVGYILIVNFFSVPGYDRRDKIPFGNYKPVLRKRNQQGKTL